MKQLLLLIALALGANAQAKDWTSEIVVKQFQADQEPLMIDVFIEGWYRDVAFQAQYDAKNYIRRLEISCFFTGGVGNYVWVGYIPAGEWGRAQSIFGLLNFPPSVTLDYWTVSFTPFYN